VDNLAEQEVRAFVGSRADYYLKKWHAALEGVGTGKGFNWAAFFLSGLWLPYRKMYVPAIIFYGIILLESTLEEVVFVGVLGRPEAPAILGRVVGFVAAYVCGYYGNQWYLSHTRKAVAAVRSQRMTEDEEAYLKSLSEVGGTNIAASLGFLALFLIAFIFILFILELLCPPGRLGAAVWTF
jgi:hypothetical protein